MLKEECVLGLSTGLYLVDEVLHFGLQTPPSELDGHQFVRTHVRTLRLQLVLSRSGEKLSDRALSHLTGSFLCALSITFHSGFRGPLPVLVEWNRAGSSSDL